MGSRGKKQSGQSAILPTHVATPRSPSLSKRKKPRETGAAPPSLTFQKDSWQVRWQKLWRKAFCASTGEETSFKGTSTEGSTEGESGQAYQDYVRESAKEDELDWITDLTVVEKGGRNSSDLERTDPGTSEYPPRTNNTREGDDFPFIHRFFGSGWVASVTTSIVNFFEPRFADPEMEETYQRERWANHKPLAMAAVAFLYLNYILYLILNHSQTTFEYIAYYGIATFFTIPVPVWIALNFPRRRPTFFQIWLSVATFWWGVSEIVQTRVCAFFATRDCHGKDFLYMMVYAIAMPVLVLFGCNLKRIYATVGATIEFVLICTLILPVQDVFVRNAVSFLIFMVFFIFLHYWIESIDRRMFILRAQLKIALKAQQKAQMLQKQAASSKKRFVSYIFHECRVPLNSAMLAFQNLQSNEAFRHAEKDQEVEIQALDSSMEAMKQVLDDVLDLQRMDSGRFNLKAEPFPFHTIVQAILGPLRVATATKDLKLVVHLDPVLDSLGKSLQHTEDLWVIGDALRFRQVLSNLCSNAVKFTDSGSITVRTIVTSKPKASSEATQTEQSEALPVSEGTQTTYTSAKPFYNRSLSAVLPELKTGEEVSEEQLREESQVSIRVEVEDTGVGIKPSESSRLFSPFFQTRLGAMQAGKGSGLGLAIVRQIVTISGGKLGVRSKKGTGSCFWFEMKFDPASVADINTSLAAATAAFSTHQTPKVDSEPLSARTRFAEPYATESPIQGTPRRTAVGWTDPSLITTLSQQGELRVPRPSTAARNQHILLDNKTLAVGLLPPDTGDLQEGDTPRAPMLKAASFPTAERTTPDPPSPSLTMPEEPISVLVVDDDSLTRKLLSRMLERLGCTVATAQDGQEAIDILLGKDAVPPRIFDMISLDNAMPVMNGQECVKALRNAGRSDFVVGATGNALKADQHAFYDAGADRILTKPVMLRDLKEVLATASSRRQNPSAA